MIKPIATYLTKTLRIPAAKLFPGLLFALCVTVALAAPGDLDPTFGTDGTVTTDFGGADVAYDVTTQPDGKIVAVGSTFTDSFATQNFALARYNLDGTLDVSFGSAGRVTTDFAGSSDDANAVAVQADGKIIVVGAAQVGNYDLALARYNSDGSLDPTFGSGGKVVTDLGQEDYLYDVLVQPDNKIAVVGATGQNSPSYTRDVALARYNPNGTLDTSFGNGGVVITNLGDEMDVAGSIVRQADGKLVVAGYTGDGNFVTADFALARYDANGTLDTSFGSSGIVCTDFGSNDGADSIALQADGRLVAAGTSGDWDSEDFALARYNTDGSLDSSFGTGGKVVTDLSGIPNAARDLVLQSDGKPLVTGFVRDPVTSYWDIALARYQTDGTLDGSFGTDGTVITDVGGRLELAFSIALQTDSRIVVAGYTTPSDFAESDFAVARFTSMPPALAVNYLSGAPGSFLAVAGTAFPANTTAAVTVNGVALGTVSTDDSGDLSFILSTASADEGSYIVIASANPTASARFVLDSDEPVRPQEGEGPVFEVPDGIAFTESVFLPMVMR